MSLIPLIPYEAINGGLDWTILTEKRPIYPYENKKRTSDIPDKIRYNVLLPGNCFATLRVSIPGSIDALASITDEQIAEGCASLRPLLVRFSNCSVKIYSINGEEQMSATASSVELVKLNK